MKKAFLLAIICCFVFEAKAQTADASSSQLLRVPEYKNPAFAYILSIIPGVGQFYNDEIGKGFALGISTGFSATLFYIEYNKCVYIDRNGNTQLRNDDHKSKALTFGIITLGLYLYQSIDAVITAHKKNKANGYVVSLYPSMQNNLCSTDNSLGFTPSIGLNLTF